MCVLVRSVHHALLCIKLEPLRPNLQPCRFAAQLTINTKEHVPFDSRSVV